MKSTDLCYRPMPTPAGLGPMQQELQRVEREFFARAMKANGGVLKHVAAVLRLNIITARKRAIKYGLWPYKKQS